jgi:predicted RNA-binding Zn ribbon-like protein
VGISKADPSPAFQLVAGHPALDFINTMDWRFRESGPEELLQSYNHLLRFIEQSKMLSIKHIQLLHRNTRKSAGERVLAACIELREAMAEVSYAWLDGRSPSAAPLRTLERHFKVARLQQRLCWKGSQLEWSWSGKEAEAELPLWLLSLATSDLMVSEAVHRVRACDNEECRWLFLDTSKNHTRRWCDMKICGNRMKARRFKAQKKT